MVTSYRERLETFGSHVIHYAPVFLPTILRLSAVAGFTAALTGWSKASAINKANGYWLKACDQGMRCLIDLR